MILDTDGFRFEVTWIASEVKFQGKYNRNRNRRLPCDITPVINKYENSTLYDILKNPKIKVRKPNMMILKAVFEGKKIGAKVYSVSDTKKGLSILKTEAYFQRLF